MYNYSLVLHINIGRSLSVSSKTRQSNVPNNFFLIHRVYYYIYS